MRLRWFALSAAVAALAPATAAAATWSAPQDLSSAHLFVDQPRLLATGDGGALATWIWSDGVGNEGRSGASAAARPPGAAAFGAQTRIVRGHAFDKGETIAEPAGFGRRGVIVASTRPVGPVTARRFRLAVRIGTVDGKLGKRTTIRTATGLGSVRVVANAAGDAALVWFEDRGVRTDRVYVALRRAGHRFGKPRRLATGRVRSVAAAIGADRDVLVAWDARGKVKTRFKPRGRAAFYATDTIRSEPAFFDDLHPVVTFNGRAAVAWSAQFASEGGSSGPVFFQVAVRAAGNGRFRQARLLERFGNEQVARPIDAVEGAPGNIDIAWSGTDGATRVVKTARFGDRLAFTPPVTISPVGTDALLSDLAAGGGHLIAVWDNGSFGANQVFAAVSPGPDQPFGPAEAVSPAQEARDGHAAFDPETFEPTVVWTNRPAGSGGPIESIRTFAQAATRSP